MISFNPPNAPPTVWDFQVVGALLLLVTNAEATKVRLDALAAATAQAALRDLVTT